MAARSLTVCSSSRGEEELLAATHMEVRVSLRGLYEGRTILQRVVLDAPVLHARLGAGGRINIGRMLALRSQTHRAPRSATLWEDVRVHDGRFEWDDATREMGLRVLDIEAAALDLQSGSHERQERFGEITLDGSLEQSSLPARLSIVCWTTSSNEKGPTFILHAALTGIDLDSLRGYVDATQRASLGVDHLDLVVSMEVRDGIIRRGAAVAISPERTRPITLLFGGPLNDPVFDRSSRLATLLELPFSRLGRLGDVVWETGDAVVGGAVGVIEAIVHGDLVGAGGSAVGTMSGGVLALGSNALDAIEAVARGLGLVAPAQPRDVAAIHAHQRALFLSERHEAGEAWSRAHSGFRSETNPPGSAPGVGEES